MFSVCGTIRHHVQQGSVSKHVILPVMSYVCILSHACFEKIESAEDVNVQSSIVHVSRSQLTTAEHLTLTTILHPEPTGGHEYILYFETITVGDDDTSPETEKYWTKCGGITLSRKDLQQIVSGKGLSDLHVNAFQNLLKRQFPHVGGLER